MKPQKKINKSKTQKNNKFFFYYRTHLVKITYKIDSFFFLYFFLDYTSYTTSQNTK